MQSDKPLRALGRSQKFGDGNGRRIRSEDGVLLHDAVEGRVHLFLVLDILDDGFDHDVAVSQVLLVGRALEPRADGVFLLGRDATLLRRPLGKLGQRLFNPGKALVEKLLLNFEHGHVEPSRRGDLSDSRAHQATTENANFLNFH